MLIYQFLDWTAQNAQQVHRQSPVFQATRRKYVVVKSISSDKSSGHPLGPDSQSEPWKEKDGFGINCSNSILYPVQEVPICRLWVIL